MCTSSLTLKYLEAINQEAESISDSLGMLGTNCSYAVANTAVRRLREDL